MSRAPVFSSRVHDPATVYARNVDSGRIVAGRAVRLACRRHLRDLERQGTRDFPYWYDQKAARKVVRFFPTFLTLEDGRPFVLPPWLQFAYGQIFGWKRMEGRHPVDVRKYIYGYFETSKGSGKSPSAAGIGLYCMTVEDEPFGEIYSAAFNKGQASIILNDGIRMANASEHLKSVLDPGKYNIANVETGSFFRAVSSEHRGKSGPRPSVVLGDEIHEHRDGSVINKLVAGFKGREQPLALLYTNSGADRTSYCWELHQKSIAVLEGVVEDEQWFAYVCHLDPCEACYAAGHRQPNDTCPACDNWTDPKVWPKVAPALGIVIQPKYLQDAVDRAQSVPSEYNLVRRLNFCIWTESHTIWIPPDQWAACKSDTPRPEQGVPTAAAFDMSTKIDLTGCVVAQRFDDDPKTTAEQVEIEDNVAGEAIKRTIVVNYRIRLHPFAWIPEDTLWERVKTEAIPYDVWKGSKHLRTTLGPAVDYHEIYDQFVNEIGPRFKPQIVGFDPHNATFLGTDLRDKAKYEAVEIKQGRALSEFIKLFYAMVRLGRIEHDGHPVLAWCVANAEPKHDRYENVWLEKPAGGKRIDLALAAVMAVSQVITLPAPRPPRKRGMAWTVGARGVQEVGTDVHA